MSLMPIYLANNNCDYKSLITEFTDTIFNHSPYLAQLNQQNPEWLHNISGQDCAQKLENEFCHCMENIKKLHHLTREDDFMQQSRLLKKQASFLIAIADISTHWDFSRISQALTEMAELLINECLIFALKQNAEEDKLSTLTQDECGFVIIALGKLGAGELNYSSDVDLLFLYDPAKFPDSLGPTRPERIGQKVQYFSHYLVRLLDERSHGGYLFRTDLRLRPNPSATPPAMTIEAALIYYESIARNWERIVMIRAHPMAGDLTLGYDFIQNISPFIWRKNLDYTALEDIYHVQQQIGDHHNSRDDFLGYNLKTGMGGIRDCEFYIQLLQLLWGGKYPKLRGRSTLKTLETLHELDFVNSETFTDLNHAYPFLRSLEHRLQMQNDLQLQILPNTEIDFEKFVYFSGFENTETFRKILQETMHKCHHHSTSLLHLFIHPNQSNLTQNKDYPNQNIPNQKLIQSLNGMNFKETDTILNTVLHWQNGTLRATASERAREILHKLLPDLLQSFSDTLNPNQAFFAFDKFLTSLPSGMQLFSLFLAHPTLMRVIADIMGNAPGLAKMLAARPALMDIFLHDLEIPQNLPEAQNTLTVALQNIDNYETILSQIRDFTHERQFNIGCHLLNGTLSTTKAASGLSLIAEANIHCLAEIVWQNFAIQHGICGNFAIIAMGKFGSGLLLPDSDLDLVFLYESSESSDGKKSLFPTTYYAKFFQRLLTALTVNTACGELYEVDLRLRPWGSDAPIAQSLQQYQNYYQNEARYWEKLALSRARVICNQGDLKSKITKTIKQILTQNEMTENYRQKITQIRNLIATQHKDTGNFNIKYKRGGLIDLEFTLQALYLQALKHGDIDICYDYHQIISCLATQEYLSQPQAKTLHYALDFYITMQAALRLTDLTQSKLQKTDKDLTMLAKATNQKNFTDCRNMCTKVEKDVTYIYNRFIIESKNTE